MDRRSFLKGAAVAVAATTIPFTLGRIKDKERIVEIDTEDGWKQIEMSYLKSGDIFRVRKGGVTVMPTAKAGGNPYIIQDDLWGIQIYKSKQPQVRKYKSPPDYIAEVNSKGGHLK